MDTIDMKADKQMSTAGNYFNYIFCHFTVERMCDYVFIFVIFLYVIRRVSVRSKKRIRVQSYDFILLWCESALKLPLTSAVLYLFANANMANKSWHLFCAHRAHSSLFSSLFGRFPIYDGQLEEKVNAKIGRWFQNQWNCVC